MVTELASWVDHWRLSAAFPPLHVTGDGEAVNFPIVG
jgi:hypothetical protein